MSSVGRIDRDVLRYHGSYPFSQWGSTWKRAYSKLPPDAAYAIYDRCVRKMSTIPIPPLAFFKDWGDQCFRILQTEQGGQQLVALYRHDQEFHLITCNVATYDKWALKNTKNLNTPLYLSES